MAKLSSINKNERRKALVKKYAAKYAKLKAVADDESVDETERLIARLKLAEIPATGTRPACATAAPPPAARAATTASSACAALSCVILPTRA
jgi:small subunit ribosomal protein S14